MIDKRDERTGRTGVGRHAQRPRPGDGPDLAPRPYQMAGQSRPQRRPGPPSDPEGTGVWTPNWDDEPAGRRQGKPAGGTPGRSSGGNRPSRHELDPTRRHHYVPPPSQRPPADPTEQPTDFIPRHAAGREQLYTHREPEPPDFYRVGAGAPPDDEDYGELALRRKRIWRRVRTSGYAIGLLLFLGPIIAFLIGYFAWDVPNAAVLGAQQTNQVVTVYFSDGQTELARVAPPNENRVNVTLDQVPKHVQDAVLAAEDRSFWSNPGFDPMGIARAVWKQATGGEGGGSTVTQQYIKVATQEDDYSLRRKFRELVLSTKISQQYSKEDILENYLNIVYFGRQAYGVQAASQAYFGKDVGQLTVSESALLAGMIQSPSRSDPSKNLPRAEGRWNFVLDGMANEGWIDRGQRATEQFPKVVPLDQLKAGAVTDSRLHIQNRAIAELEAAGFDTATVHEYGGKIITTIDPRAQQVAVDAVNRTLEGHPPNLRSALVAVDPKTGAIRAYFGGHEGTGIDLASPYKLFQSPGSAFKPFVMLAGLEQGKGLGDVYDGSSPLKIDGLEFNNNESNDYADVTLKKAMTYSVNTTFVQLTKDVTPLKVADAAHRSGIPETVEGQRTLVNSDGSPPGLAIGLGALPVRPIDMASAYATFAANGAQREPYLVAEFINAKGESIYKHADRGGQQVLDPGNPERNAQLACNVTDSLIDVPAYSKFPLKGNRPSAAKTGTDQRGDTGENDNSWTVGYTPSVSAAVWVGDPAQAAIKTKTGRNVFGATLAGPIWKAFMDGYLEPIPPAEDKFPKCKPIGKDETTTTPEQTRDRGRGNDKKPTTTTTTQPTRGRQPPPTSEITLTCPPLLCPPTQTTAGGGGEAGG